MKLPPEASIANRALACWAHKRLLPRQAARQLLAAAEALTLAALASLERLRDHGAMARLAAENKRLRIENTELCSELTILRSRLQAIPPRQRPHYSPHSRFLILHHMRTSLLSLEETARRFLLSAQTLRNWLQELHRNPAATIVGTLLRPTPPLRRYHDVQRRLVRQMKEQGFGGDRLIAASLARFAWTPSRRSVGRFAREKTLPTPPPRPEPVVRDTTVEGRYPNHVWMADITRIPTLFPFFHLHLTVVFDAFARLPLRAALSWLEPSALAMIELFQAATREHGRPRHFVSDQGSAFTAQAFRAALCHLGVRQRFGALYNTDPSRSSSASSRPSRLIWACRAGSPGASTNSHIASGSSSSATPTSGPIRPWEAACPSEAYFGIAYQRPRGNLAPRGRAGDPDLACPFEVAFLDPQSRTLPILLPTPA